MRKYSTILLLLFVLPLCTMAQGGVSTSLFTGRMSYTIPIYTIEDPDFKVDLALCYSSEGFKPFQPSGCYGQDWSLIAGGCITRQVMGIPDEWEYNFEAGINLEHEHVILKYTKCGFLRMFENFNDTLIYDPIGFPATREQLFNMDESIYDLCGVHHPEAQGDDNHNYRYREDLMPDIFYFSFCGHSGSFMINNSGDVVILNGDFVTVDMSNLKENAVNGANTNYTYSSSRPVPQITIQTTDGYMYVFGGTSSSVEYSVETLKNDKVTQDTPSVSAWHITQIIAPNGRQLTFKYVENESLTGPLRSFLTDYDWTEEGENTHIKYFLHKDCLLQSISTSDSIPLNIKFYSSKESRKMYYHSDFTYCPQHLQLDSIEVTCNNRTLRKAKLSYTYHFYPDALQKAGEAESRYFFWRYLNQVSISGVGKYELSYDYFDPYPNDSNSWMITYNNYYPDIYPKTDSEYKDLVDRYGFWKVSSLQGMLKKVSLPTGGSIEFKYGTHEYGTERRFRIFTPVSSKELLYESLSNADQPIGGARIETVKLYSEPDKLVETKTFTYKKNGSSTGIFYNIYEIYDAVADKRMAVANPYNYNLISSHIGYSYVEKETTIGSEKSKMTYSYNTGTSAYGTEMATSTINRKYDIQENKRYGINAYDRITELCSGSLTHDQWLTKPGKLAETKSYEGEKLIKHVKYTYNNGATTMHYGGLGNPPITTNILGCVDTIVCISTYSAHTARKLYVCPDVLEKVTTKEYVDDIIMETVKEYRYDKKLRKKKETITDSRGRRLFTKYTYPDEIPTSYCNNPYHLLSLNNRIGKPIETVSGYIENNTEYVTGGTIDIYTNSFYRVVHGGPVHRPVPYLYKTLSLTSSNPVTNYQPFGMDNDSVTYDPHYHLTCEYEYDKKFRLLSMKPFGGMKTQYTWDGIYPVTKTTGNQTWRYEYIPYVGVKSTTDPRGITTYYTYDAAGRLIEEYQLIDGKKQILHAYHYHIKTE